ncbi:HofP DNA utilization family protein [Erwinia persicina]|uniref:DUF2531 domain-containing protein n=1 Tax=Erwinia persicina TaxID=55211 RepID=A0A4V6X8M5_9GAMM|nr:HofP DNA utilization family protein [Erwinia persicina]MBC3947826.1 DUF2531 family protein [Erwinia persicina]MBD8108879.1 DUF2531 family protein [Erwinia persicina]MBD8211978.1 DUF2531 family protein [Erwinia persicina]TKJ90457.1 DUF2531 domain-containing protein [Erwinia persicina]
MTTKLAFCLLLLLMTSVCRARDPFFVADLHRCRPAEDARVPWRLLGIIGREGRYHGWLLSPQGKLVRATTGEMLPDTAWRIASVEEEAITLASSLDCQPRLRLALKGRQDAENILAVADTD